MKIISVVGARPNFMKVAPLHREFSKRKDLQSIIVHTGQHYDERMSKVFLEQLELPEPDYFLGVGSGSHAAQTAKIMMAFEEVLDEENPDWVIVVGDVNSTVACALAAAKMHIKVAHVEAGLRSGDRTMPEEINRIVTDSISDLLFVTEQSAIDNLRKEGVPDEKVHFVGNVMIDSLVRYLPKAAPLRVEDIISENCLGNCRNCLPDDEQFILMTMHRPSNVDSKEDLLKILEIVERVSDLRKVLFIVHPRTLNNLKNFELLDSFSKSSNLILLKSLGYLEFLKLLKDAQFVITDSGGVQEETTYLGVPCVTLRENTERPITIEVGSNTLVSELSPCKIMEIVNSLLYREAIHKEFPPLWDGKSANRIAKALIQVHNHKSPTPLSIG